MVNINVRIGGFYFGGDIMHSRFGFSPDDAFKFINIMNNEEPFAQFSGLHFHLNGYSIEQRAAAIDQGAARLMGIDVNFVIMIVFFIGPALGGAAGLMVGVYYGQINFTMGWIYGLKAFTAAILGGIGNIPGAMVGGLLLGVIEALGAAYISIAWKDAIAFFVLILILIVRPTGLLGERVAEKI